jgi:hypothetical protein
MCAFNKDKQGVMVIICGKHLKRNIMKGEFCYVSGKTIPALLSAAFVFIVHSLKGLEDRLL